MKRKNGHHSTFSALKDTARIKAREAATAGDWPLALQWIENAPRDERPHALEALTKYRVGGQLIAKGMLLEAQEILSSAPRTADFPAYLIDERQRLVRTMLKQVGMAPSIVGSTCELCDGCDLYRVATCRHQRAPVQRASKLHPDALNPPIRTSYAAGAYRSWWDPAREDAMSALIRRTKGRIDPVAIQWIGALLVDFVTVHTPLPGHVDALVAVPTSRAREMRRGGELPGLLARALRDGLGLPLREPIVQIGEHLDHTQASGPERRAALRAAWKHTADGVLVGRSVLLVDDIVTTGTTLKTAAELLLEGGAGEVHAIALLHTERSS